MTPGEVQSIYSDGEFEHVLKKHADQLVVVCASSSDCVPCRAFEPLFEVSHMLVSVCECVPIDTKPAADSQLSDIINSHTTACIHLLGTIAAAFCVVVQHSHICTHRVSFALTLLVCVYGIAWAWFLAELYERRQ